MENEIKIFADNRSFLAISLTADGHVVMDVDDDNPGPAGPAPVFGPIGPDKLREIASTLNKIADEL